VLGIYTVIDVSGRELSETDSYAAAREAIRVHLMCDGEEGPLTIIGPDGGKVASGELDGCNRILFRTSSLSRRYEEVVKIWGRPER